MFARILPHWFDPENADIEDLEEALRQISRENRALSAFETTIPFSHFYKGEMRLAAQALRESSAAVFSSGSSLAAGIWFRVAATVERFQGRLVGAEAVLKDGSLFLDQFGPSGPHLKFMLDLQTAWILYARNDLEAALEHATAVLRFVEQTRFPYEIADVNHLLASIYTRRGEKDKSDRCVQRMERAVRAIGTPSLIALTDAHIARLYSAAGGLEMAQGWMKRRKLSMDEPFSLRFALEGLTHAEILVRLGRYREAQPVLETLRFRCEGQNMMEAVLEIDLLRSGSLHALNDRHRARTVMEKALSFSEAEGYLRPFVDQARVISPVLTDMARTDWRTSYVSSIMKACGAGLATSRDAGVPADAGVDAGKRLANLTKREMNILELMAAGYRDKEIAEKAFISLHTVRTHTKHILGKLDVRTRVQAVRRAEELKVLGNQ